MDDQKQTKEKQSGKPLYSVILLVVLLAAVIYMAPRLEPWIAEWKAKQQEQKQGEQSASGQDQVEGSTQPQCPDRLKAWLPLIEEQLPTDTENGTKTRLVHVRLSKDETRLLLDLERSHLGKSERVDVILFRDEFGRYISQQSDMPMKIYPPDEPNQEPATASGE